ncbi:MAG: hypothetical protein V4594_17675 [Bacteroidota bacterium]
MKFVLLVCLLFLFPEADFRSYYSEGVTALKKKEYKKAIDQFSKSYALKKMSFSSYYLAISYFKLSNDSMALKFARRAESEPPKLGPAHQQNIDHIYRYSMLGKTRDVKFDIVQSEAPRTDVNSKAIYTENKNRKSSKSVEKKSVPKTSLEIKRLREDLFILESRELPIESDAMVDPKTGNMIEESIIDSL